jgi:hypothetical protein
LVEHPFFAAPAPPLFTRKMLFLKKNVWYGSSAETIARVLDYGCKNPLFSIYIYIYILLTLPI